MEFLVPQNPEERNSSSHKKGKGESSAKKCRLVRDMLVRRRVPIKSKNLNPLRVLTSFDNIGSMAHENGGVRYDVSHPLYLCMCIYIYIYKCIFIKHIHISRLSNSSQ